MNQQDSESNSISSKRSLKRKVKRQEYLESRKEKRRLQRLQRKNKPSNGDTLSRKCIQRKGVKIKDSKCNIGVILDLSYDEYMNERDIGKVIRQITRVYGINRRLNNPLQLHVTSFSGSSKEAMEKNIGFEYWDCSFTPLHFTELNYKKIIYLTSDSPNVLTQLDEETYYVIGGLVDHNAHKGISLQEASKRGIQTARLPLEEFVHLETRKVLTINHVYHILALVTENKSWKDAFLSALPPRKGIVAKEEKFEKDEDKEKTEI